MFLVDMTGLVKEISREIERKFLIRENGLEYGTDSLCQLYASIDSLKKDVLARGEPIRQGYVPREKAIVLADELGISVRFKPEEARLRDKAGKFYFTLKGEGSGSRNEIEIPLTQELFEAYWAITEGRRVRKVRLERPHQRYVLVLDVYLDRDLIIAEVEVPTEKDVEKLKPLGLDVTTYEKYKNVNLAK